MSKKVAIVQSSYIPWKGYFDLIRAVDEFILFDDVQYTRRDWRNLNRIKTKDGTIWLTIPVHSTGNYLEPIKCVTISDPKWAVRHWRTIQSNYGRARHFACYRAVFEELYLSCAETRLSVINRSFIEAVCGILGIRTKLSWSMDYRIDEGKTERIVSLCQQVGATTYVSGPTALGYIDAGLFQKEGIELVFFDYSGYPEYEQLFPPFDHQVSVLDLIFNEGPDASRRMLTF